MIRILQVVNAADRGGAETMIMNLYRNIDKSRIQFDFTNHKGKPAAYDEEIYSMGGRVISLPKFKGYNYIQYVNAWENLFREHPEYKIIHIHNYNISGIVSKVAKRMGVRAIITHAHSTRLNMSKFRQLVFNIFRRSMLQNSTHLFSCGQNAGRFLFGRQFFTLLPNAIDTKKFKFDNQQREKLRSSLGINPEIKVYGHVGSFRKPKNHDFLINIFSNINKVDPEAKFLLIGSGELQDSIRTKVEVLGLSSSIIFLGQQPNVNEWLSAFDVFIMPSLWEGMPVSVIEAQCAGLPCIISDVIDGDVNITGQVHFISLNESADDWAKTAMRVPKVDRILMGQQIATSAYNIDSTVDWITNFYIGSYNHYGA